MQNNSTQNNTVNGREIRKNDVSNNYSHTYVTLCSGALWFGKLLTANDLRKEKRKEFREKICIWFLHAVERNKAFLADRKLINSLIQKN